MLGLGLQFFQALGRSVEPRPNIGGASRSSGAHTSKGAYRLCLEIFQANNVVGLQNHSGCEPKKGWIRQCMTTRASPPPPAPLPDASANASDDIPLSSTHAPILAGGSGCRYRAAAASGASYEEEHGEAAARAPAGAHGAGPHSASPAQDTRLPGDAADHLQKRTRSQPEPQASQRADHQPAPKEARVRRAGNIE
eukprot:1180182-Prorocentrum_minimum.AAC.1